ncbi:hypothetical protein TH53_09345 [Pedobacter lusitanus]|uniref:Uncharacterized protein n=1 Tax=Pedobacter lusitanus TaxID=1503925 RepID=A0A0D0GJM7_9SPHI|nr:hypothetical protein TH53_09345 [Pedobacter lusitanus]
MIRDVYRYIFPVLFLTSIFLRILHLDHLQGIPFHFLPGGCQYIPSAKDDGLVHDRNQGKV